MIARHRLSPQDQRKFDRCHNKATAVGVGAERRSTRANRRKPWIAGKAFNKAYERTFKACFAGRAGKRRR